MHRAHLPEKRVQMARVSCSAWNIRRVAYLATLLFATYSVESIGVGETTLEVQWSGGRLSVAAYGVPLARILTAVAEKTGMEVRGLDDCTHGHPGVCGELVSDRFSSPSLREGLHELLAQRMDYVYVEDRGLATPTLVLVFEGDPNSQRPGPDVTNQNDGNAQSGAVATRLAALESSAAQGNADALQQALRDPEPAVQSLALDLLADRDPGGVLKLLSGSLRSPHAQVRLTALQLLRGNDRADKQLILSTLGQAIDDEDVAVKRYAIRALAELGGGEALQYLHRALQDVDPAIRITTVEHIVHYVVPEQRVALLEQAAADKDENVRSAAAASLQELRGKL